MFIVGLYRPTVWSRVITLLEDGQDKSVAVAKKKADRTAYDVRYSCRTNRRNFRVWNSHDHIPVGTVMRLLGWVTVCWQMNPCRTVGTYTQPPNCIAVMEHHVTATEGHLPYGITTTRHKWTHPAFTPASQAGTRFTYPGGIEGWVDLGDLLHTEMVYNFTRPQAATHQSTNRAQCRLTSLIKPTRR